MNNYNISNAQKSQLHKIKYNDYLNNTFHSNDTNCYNSQTFSDSNLKSPMYLTHNLPLQFSDENPFRDNIKDKEHRIIRKKKIWISNTHKKESTSLPEEFSVSVQGNYKNIRFIKLVQIAIDYTVDATLSRDGFVYFPDFPSSEETTGPFFQKYHGYFPITQDTIGTTVRFNYTFNDSYISDFTKVFNIGNQLRVQVFYENTSTGKFTAFTQLNHIGIELEIDYIDFANDNDTQTS